MAKQRQEESLFIVSEQSGQITPADFVDSEFASVSLEERNIRLQNVVTYLAEKSMLEGFVSHRAPSEKSYSEAAEEVREKARSKIADISHKAKVEFAHASGHFKLIESGATKSDAARITRSLFSDFLKEYYGPLHYKKAQAYRRQLASNFDILRAERNDLIPAVTVVEPEALPSESNDQNRKLDNHEKLEVLLTDPRAKFLPATNREKTTALTLLSYLDSDKATAEQLLEVFTSAQKLKGAGVNEGLRALESLVYEMGDYYENAVTSLEHLEDFEKSIREVLNPRLSLELAIETLDHPGYAVLFRFIKLTSLYESKVKNVHYYHSDPMLTVEDRDTKEGPGKHKKVYDRYTTPHPDAEITEQIKRFVRTTSVGDIRKSIVEAKVNEQNRAQFFEERITEVGNLSSVSRIFRNVVNIAGEITKKANS